MVDVCSARSLCFSGLVAVVVTGCASGNCELIGTPAAIETIVVPQEPDIAVQQGFAGTAVYDVVVKPDGTVASITIASSSGFALLDQAAIAGARASTYRGQSSPCGGTPGNETVVYTATFNGQTATAS